MKYHKIQTVFHRDPENRYKTLLEGRYALPEFEYLKDNNWMWTEKVDGTNIRIMFDGKDVTFGGKTDRAQIPSDLVNYLAKKFLTQLGGFFDAFHSDEVDGVTNVCLYGEGYGPKIQKGGGLYRDTQGFVLFDVRIGSWWLKRRDVEGLGKQFNTDVVPIVGEGTLIEAVELVKSGFQSTWGDFQAEGIVARPEVELKARNGGRVITKIKYKDFARK